tara:strand:- start:222 stop:518 length:297 start_codon:yes stop_codon:yes gene_type:complete
MKLKKLIKESTWGKRAFGEKLPTIQDYQNAMNEDKLNEGVKIPVPSKYIDSKTWKNLKYDIGDQIDELVELGEDYEIFQSAQHTARTLKKIKRLWDKL